MSAVKKPFAYYGGKSHLAPTLIGLLPQHRVYVEVFGGSAALLFAKPPSALEVYNDLDSGLVGFFRVLRDPAKAQALREQLELTPYAREEYELARKLWRAPADEIERVRQWYVTMFMSFSGHMAMSGWSYTIVPHANPARKFRNTLATFGQFTERLANVQVENADFDRVLAAYDSPDTLFYLDPPYVAASRRSTTIYTHEMTDADHTRLLDAVEDIQGMAILSCYAHPLYDARLAGWERLTKTSHAWSVAHTQASGLKGHGAAATQAREEVIWLNPACVRRQASLWQGVQGMEAIS